MSVETPKSPVKSVKRKYYIEWYTSFGKIFLSEKYLSDINFSLIETILYVKGIGSQVSYFSFEALTLWFLLATSFLY